MLPCCNPVEVDLEAIALAAKKAAKKAKKAAAAAAAEEDVDPAVVAEAQEGINSYSPQEGAPQGIHRAI